MTASVALVAGGFVWADRTTPATPATTECWTTPVSGFENGNKVAIIGFDAEGNRVQFTNADGQSTKTLSEDDAIDESALFTLYREDSWADGVFALQGATADHYLGYECQVIASELRNEVKWTFDDLKANKITMHTVTSLGDGYLYYDKVGSKFKLTDTQDDGLSLYQKNNVYNPVISDNADYEGTGTALTGRLDATNNRIDLKYDANATSNPTITIKSDNGTNFAYQLSYKLTVDGKEGNWTRVKKANDTDESISFTINIADYKGKIVKIEAKTIVIADGNKLDETDKTTQTYKIVDVTAPTLKQCGSQGTFANNELTVSEEGYASLAFTQNDGIASVAVTGDDSKEPEEGDFINGIVSVSGLSRYIDKGAVGTTDASTFEGTAYVYTRSVDGTFVGSCVKNTVKVKANKDAAAKNAVFGDIQISPTSGFKAGTKLTFWVSNDTYSIEGNPDNGTKLSGVKIGDVEVETTYDSSTKKYSCTIPSAISTGELNLSVPANAFKFAYGTVTTEEGGYGSRKVNTYFSDAKTRTLTATENLAVYTLATDAYTYKETSKSSYTMDVQVVSPNGGTVKPRTGAAGIMMTNSSNVKVNDSKVEYKQNTNGEFTVTVPAGLAAGIYMIVFPASQLVDGVEGKTGTTTNAENVTAYLSLKDPVTIKFDSDKGKYCSVADNVYKIVIGTTPSKPVKFADGKTLTIGSDTYTSSDLSSDGTITLKTNPTATVTYTIPAGTFRSENSYNEEGSVTFNVIPHDVPSVSISPVQAGSTTASYTISGVNQPTPTKDQTIGGHSATVEGGKITLTDSKFNTTDTYTVAFGAPGTGACGCAYSTLTGTVTVESATWTATVNETALNSKSHITVNVSASIDLSDGQSRSIAWASGYWSGVSVKLLDAAGNEVATDAKLSGSDFTKLVLSDITYNDGKSLCDVSTIKISDPAFQYGTENNPVLTISVPEVLPFVSFAMYEPETELTFETGQMESDGCTFYIATTPDVAFAINEGKTFEINDGSKSFAVTVTVGSYVDGKGYECKAKSQLDSEGYVLDSEGNRVAKTSLDPQAETEYYTCIPAQNYMLNIPAGHLHANNNNNVEILSRPLVIKNKVNFGVESSKYAIDTEATSIVVNLTAVDAENGNNMIGSTTFGSQDWTIKGINGTTYTGTVTAAPSNAGDGEYLVTFSTSTLPVGNYKITVPAKFMTANYSTNKKISVTVNVAEAAEFADAAVEIDQKTTEFDVEVVKDRDITVASGSSYTFGDYTATFSTSSKTGYVHVTLDNALDATEVGGVTEIIRIPANSLKVDNSVNTNEVLIIPTVLYRFDNNNGGEITLNSELPNYEVTIDYHQDAIKKGAKESVSLPFDVPYETIKDQARVQKISAAWNEYDSEGKKVAVFKLVDVTEGTLYANRPYVITPSVDKIEFTLNSELDKLQDNTETRCSTTSDYICFKNTWNAAAGTTRQKLTWSTPTTVFYIAATGAYQGDFCVALLSSSTMNIWKWYAESTSKGISYARFVEDGDELTGIDGVNAESENATIYNVAGQRLNSVKKNSLNIVNGKKYIIN